jgi:hypothetical protein
MKKNESLPIAIEGLCRAGVQAGGILAVAALNGKPVVSIRILDPNPR